MATDPVPVTPQVLRWARESAQVTLHEAARRANVTETRVEEWESGGAEPSLAKLRSLAGLYHRPLSVFLLPTPPIRFAALRDFRRHPQSDDRGWSHALHKVFVRAEDQQAAVIDLADLEGESVFNQVPPLSMTVEAETAGTDLRRALNVPLSQQFSWRKPEEALAHWISAAEDLGVFVLRTSDVDRQEMRGFSIPGDAPVIVVNALDWPRGQIFTLMHELAHLTLREGGLCDLLEPESPAARTVEVWCNAVAASVLMPRREFEAELTSWSQNGVAEDDLSDPVLTQLSHRWGVSQEAVARRLVTLGLAPLAFYQGKRQEYQEAWERLREDERARRLRSERSGGPPPHRMTIRDRGRPYVRLVLAAYNSDLVTTSSASSLLGLGVKHLSALEHEAGE